jgi:hypothetical protein
MTTKGFGGRLALAVGLLGAVTIALAAAPADAAPRGGRAGAHAGPHAGAHARAHAGAHPRGDYTHHTERQKTENGHTREDTWTNSHGKTATRDATVVRDKDAGTVSRDVVETGPNGKTRTVSDDRQRTDDGYTRETVRTNPNGSTLTRDVTATYDKDTKTFSKDVSVDRERATPPDAQP